MGLPIMRIIVFGGPTSSNLVGHTISSSRRATVTTIVPLLVDRIWGIYWDSGNRIWGIYWDSGKENGNYFTIIGYILGLYGENRKDNGSYYLGV